MSSELQTKEIIGTKLEVRTAHHIDQTFRPNYVCVDAHNMYKELAHINYQVFFLYALLWVSTT